MVNGQPMQLRNRHSGRFIDQQTCTCLFEGMLHFVSATHSVQHSCKQSGTSLLINTALACTTTTWSDFTDQHLRKCHTFKQQCHLPSPLVPCTLERVTKTWSNSTEQHLEKVSLQTSSNVTCRISECHAHQEGLHP